MASKNAPIRKFTFSTGVSVNVKKVSAVAGYEIQRTTPNKPVRPAKPIVNIAEPGESEMLEYNPDDPVYKAMLDQYDEDFADWNRVSNERFFDYLLQKAVSDNPPKAWLTENGHWIDGKSKVDIKKLWIYEQMSDLDEIETFTEFVLGGAVPTGRGISDSEKKFHADGERDTSSE